ncbi:hypothetical protein niasHT_002624 [Heterodera trifolii]|uniref:Uncharacterized protein n=1 Tax=Heterodera trifolii TaxID=157864 RepID=A0ABD2LU68_9BILA
MEINQPPQAQSKTNTSAESICPLLAAEVPPAGGHSSPANSVPPIPPSVRPICQLTGGLGKANWQIRHNFTTAEKPGTAHPGKWEGVKEQTILEWANLSKFKISLALLCLLPAGAKGPPLAVAVALTGHGLATGHTNG